MFPMVLALVAIYVILDFTGQYVHWLGLNTQSGLIMVYLGGISGYIWMIKGYFDTIPASMEESARIDGASQFQTFVQILLPISLPIFAVVFILSFIASCPSIPWPRLFCSRETTGRWRSAPIRFCPNTNNSGAVLRRSRS